jgi:probable selenium-dependent hydroxylase accessory protein YqeC
MDSAPEILDCIMALVPNLAVQGRGRIAAFVGAGGKTSALFAVAREAAGRGLSVLVTTTTHMYDPRDEGGRGEDEVLLLSGYARRRGPGAGGSPDWLHGRARSASLTVLASGKDKDSLKLDGVDPAWVPELAGSFDLVLVEADGSRGLPVKAPGEHEPVLPPLVDLVFGLIGLDCLNAKAGSDSVHRFEAFQQVTGIEEGSPIGAGHLSHLVTSSHGLFKGCAPATRRIVLLNKADLAKGGDAVELWRLLRATPSVDAVFLTAFSPAQAS